MIETNEEIIPPIGSIKSKKDGIISYKKLMRFTKYEMNKGRTEIWQGVECEGNPENQKTIYTNEQNISVCDLCKNQVSCMFNNGLLNNSFKMKDEFADIERESIAIWVQKNKKKYKIKIKGSQKYNS